MQEKRGTTPVRWKINLELNRILATCLDIEGYIANKKLASFYGQKMESEVNNFESLQKYIDNNRKAIEYLEVLANRNSNVEVVFSVTSHLEAKKYLQRILKSIKNIIRFKDETNDEDERQLIQENITTLAIRLDIAKTYYEVSTGKSLTDE